MNRMGKVFLITVLIVSAVFITSCEEVQELLTTVSGTIEDEATAVSDAVVIALNSEGDAYQNLGEVNELSEDALEALGSVVKGFDVTGSDASGNYEATIISEGGMYIVSISDENGNSELDSLDLFGWYGNDSTLSLPDHIAIDTFNIGGYDIVIDSTMIDTVNREFTYTIPQEITVEEGDDLTGIHITNMMEYKWVEKLSGN